MSLAHPALSLTGKKKGKQKFASAAAKRTHDELAKQWTQKQVEWKKLSAVPTTTIAKGTPNAIVGPKKIGKSLNSWVTGPVSSKPNPVYTGTAIIGIAVQHKSCLQPIFNEDAAKDSASMRR